MPVLLVVEILFLGSTQSLLHGVVHGLGRTQAGFYQMQPLLRLAVLLFGRAELLSSAVALGMNDLHLFQEYALEVLPRAKKACARVLDMVLKRIKLAPDALVGLFSNGLKPLQRCP